MTEEPTVTYTSASGESFTFDEKHSLLVSDDERAWEYGTDGGAPVLEPRTLDARLVYTGEGMRGECERLLGLAYADLDSQTPGTYTVGEWSLRCYLLKGAAYSSMPSWAGWKVSLYAPDPVWRRETCHEFLPGSTSSTDVGGFDYETDYPHDLGAAAKSSELAVAAVAPCDFRLTVYGYAAKPSVYIAGNRYGVDVTVPSGGLLVIDSTKKASMQGDSVVLRDKYGNAQDVFPKRVKGAEGSGSYIFERIPGGTHSVTWDQGWGFSLDLIERRAALPWT